MATPDPLAAIEAAITAADAELTRLRDAAAGVEARLARYRRARAALTGGRTPVLRPRGATHPVGGPGDASRADRVMQVARLLADKGPLGSTAISAAIGYATPSVATLLRERQPDPPLIARNAAGRYPVWELTAAGRAAVA